MANRQRAEARRKAAAKASRQEGTGSSKLVLWVAVGVVLVLGVGGIVWAVNRDTSTPASNATTTSVGSGVPDSQPVVIKGTRLVDFNDKVNPDPAVGVVAPTVDGKNYAGDPVSINPSNGPYMVVFLAHWCPHCNAEIPRLLAWKHSGAVPAELNVIGVGTAVSKASINYPPAEWFSNKGWDWPVMADESQGDGNAGKAAAAFGATAWPYFVIVGADGKVKVRVSGEVQISELQKIVDAALKA
jgi:thiol-disulfide isomerase/thioredoxin